MQDPATASPIHDRGLPGRTRSRNIVKGPRDDPTKPTKSRPKVLKEILSEQPGLDTDDVYESLYQD